MFSFGGEMKGDFWKKWRSKWKK